MALNKFFTVAFNLHADDYSHFFPLWLILHTSITNFMFSQLVPCYKLRFSTVLLFFKPPPTSCRRKVSGIRLSKPQVGSSALSLSTLSKLNPSNRLIAESQRISTPQNLLLVQSSYSSSLILRLRYEIVAKRGRNFNVLNALIFHFLLFSEEKVWRSLGE